MGVIAITNSGGSPCQLQGYLGISLPVGRDSNLVPVDVVHDGYISSTGFLRAAPGEPSPVTMQPGQSVWIGFRWTNWCNAQEEGSVKLILPNTGQLSVPTAALFQVTTCTNSNDTAILDEGPVQEPAS